MRECARACGCLAARPVSLGTPAMAGVHRFVPRRAVCAHRHVRWQLPRAGRHGWRCGMDVPSRRGHQGRGCGRPRQWALRGRQLRWPHVRTGLAGYPTLSAAALAHHSFAVYALPSGASPFCGTLRVLRVLSRLVLLSEYLRCVAFRRASSCVSGGAGKQPWGHDAGTSKCSGCSVARRP